MKVKIGLEVHVGLATESKLFCACPTYGTDNPNSRVCPVCLGYPGSRPVPNSRAIQQALALCHAVKSKVDSEVLFSRKCYFYPDMPRNYQITQFEKPLGTGGEIKLKSGKTIRLIRIHLEEDPAAITYPGSVEKSEYSLIDYNRAGCPLVEIVTEPDFESPGEARELLKELTRILSYIGVKESDDIMKADANISIEETGFTRVEIKNISGYKDVEQALKFEIIRQRMYHKTGKKVIRETRGWDGGKTFHMRSKEQEADYGYITEPDIPIIHLEDEFLAEAKAMVPELGYQKITRYTEQYYIDPVDADVLASDREVAELFDVIIEKADPQITARWLRRELRRVLNYSKKDLSETFLNPDRITEIILLLHEEKITEEVGQRLMEILVEKDFSPVKYVEENKLLKMIDDTSLKDTISIVVAEEKKAVEDYKAGEEKSLMFLVGQTMKKTKGTADPNKVKKILREIIDDS